MNQNSIIEKELNRGDPGRWDIGDFPNLLCSSSREDFIIHPLLLNWIRTFWARNVKGGEHRWYLDRISEIFKIFCALPLFHGRLHSPSLLRQYLWLFLSFLVSFDENVWWSQKIGYPRSYETIVLFFQRGLHSALFSGNKFVCKKFLGKKYEGRWSRKMGYWRFSKAFLLHFQRGGFIIHCLPEFVMKLKQLSNWYKSTNCIS